MTSEQIKDVILALGGLGWLVPLVGLLMGKRGNKAAARKTEADYADQISETAMKLVSPLEKRVSELEKRLKRLNRLVERYAKRIVYLMGGIDQLIRQIVSMQASPCWQPDDWDPDEEIDDKGENHD